MRQMDEAPDLDLLRLFDVLHHERHLTRAAGRVGRSQPAMSRALGRMRELFGDQLFVRTPKGMLPTPRADALAPEVRRILREAEALVRPRTFDPAKLERAFVIGTSDLVDVHMLARLMSLLSREAPGVDVVIRSGERDVAEPLAEGRLDLYVAPKEVIPEGLVIQHLFDGTLLCAARRDHPRLRRKLSLALYVELLHVQIAPGGAPGGPVDDALAARGLVRRVAVRTPSFAAAPLLVAQSDFVLTAPSQVLSAFAKPLALRIYPLPLTVPTFRIHQAWHARVQADPAHRWFRAAFARAARST